MDLLLVRHGISEHNTSDVISGGTSNPNLSQAGVKQVEEISKIIDNNKIDQVYASPLIRAKILLLMTVLKKWILVHGKVNMRKD